jgi:hypothetical protein
MKLTPDQQRTLIPDDEVRRAFLQREDIAHLSPEEQETRWARHQIALDKFREFLSGVECLNP